MLVYFLSQKIMLELRHDSDVNGDDDDSLLENSTQKFNKGSSNAIQYVQVT